MTNEEKMLAGKIYDSSDPSLQKKLARSHRLCKMYNDTFDDEIQKRQDLIDQLLPEHGKNTFLQGPIFFDYGCNTKVGDNFYANYNLTVLDTCPVVLGSNEFFGPNVTLATPLHGLLAKDRNIQTIDGKESTLEYGKPLTIGDSCWLGSNVVVNGGVTIGPGSVIGSGSVVTRDIPSNVLAVGNPCRVVRKLTDDDQIKIKEELW